MLVVKALYAFKLLDANIISLIYLSESLESRIVRSGRNSSVLLPKTLDLQQNCSPSGGTPILYADLSRALTKLY